MCDGMHQLSLILFSAYGFHHVEKRGREWRVGFNNIGKVYEIV
jgi:hypothetical protein